MSACFCVPEREFKVPLGAGRNESATQVKCLRVFFETNTISEWSVARATKCICYPH